VPRVAEFSKSEEEKLAEALAVLDRRFTASPSTDANGGAFLAEVAMGSLAKKRIAIARGETFVLDQRLIHAINQDFLGSCPKDAKECPVESVLMHFYYFQKRFNPDFNLQEPDSIEEDLFLFWLMVLEAKYFSRVDEQGMPGLFPHDVYDFSYFVKILNAEGRLTLGNRAWLLEGLKNTHAYEGFQIREKLQFAFGKIIAARELLEIYETEELAETSYISDSGIREELCAEIPTEEAVVELNDACLMNNYFLYRTFCGTEDRSALANRIIDVMMAYESRSRKDNYCKAMFILNYQGIYYPLDETPQAP